MVVVVVLLFLGLFLRLLICGSTSLFAPQAEASEALGKTEAVVPLTF